MPRVSRPRSRMALLLGLLGALLVGGCQFDSASPIYTPRNACSSNADCPVGICTEGICTSVTSAPIELAISVASPTDVPSDEGFAYTLDDVLIDGSTVLALDVPAHVRVHGRVSASDLPVAAQVSAVRATPTGLVLGLDVQSSRTVADLPLAADALPDHYALRVAADEDYLVYAEPVGVYNTVYPGAPAPPPGPNPPLSTLFPPLLLSGYQASEASAGPDGVRLDLAYPSTIFDDCSSQKLEGCTLRGVVHLVDGLGQDVTVAPGAGFTVRAWQPDLGLAVSSSGQTNINGEWDVRITPGVTAYRLVIDGIEGTGLPKVKLDSASLVFQAGVVHVYLPALEPIPYVGIVETAQGQALANATVTLTSTSLPDAPSGLDLTLDTTAKTSDGAGGDRIGQFDTQLWPGTYDVVITPADPAQGSSLRTTLTIYRPLAGGALIGQLFRIPAPVRLGGRAITARGDAAPYVGLTAVPQSTYDLSGSPLDGMRVTSVRTTADPTGLFELQVDRGRYDLLLSASLDAGWGAVVVPGLDLRTGTSLPDVDVVLPPPLLVKGSVTIGGVPPGFSEGVVLSAFLVLRDAGPMRLAPIGQFVAEPDGTYRMLISPL